MALKLTVVSLKEANAFVKRLHRHSAPVIGHKFSVGVSLDGVLCGVAIIGRPISCKLDNQQQLEVLRCCTDGTRNACSMLYGAAFRGATAMGYTKILTYILERESGSSLKASGYHCEAVDIGGGDWTTSGRVSGSGALTRSGAPLLEMFGLADPRKHDKGKKQRWARCV